MPYEHVSADANAREPVCCSNVHCWGGVRNSVLLLAMKAPNKGSLVREWKIQVRTGRQSCVPSLRYCTLPITNTVSSPSHSLAFVFSPLSSSLNKKREILFCVITHRLIRKKIKDFVVKRSSLHLKTIVVYGKHCHTILCFHLQKPHRHKTIIERT